MSDYLLLRYRPVAEELLSRHGLSVSDDVYGMLAKTIMRNRVNPGPRLARSRSPMPSLRRALTHTNALLRYADKPPARSQSIALRAGKLASALRDNELVGLELILTDPSFDPLQLLDALDTGKADRSELLRLLATLKVATSKTRKIGRPWAAFTAIIRAGCIAWQRAGGQIKSKWNVDEERLSGKFPDFLRELIACCNGKHELVRVVWGERPRPVPKGHIDPRQAPKGDGLKVSDLALRDAIRAYQEWRKTRKQKI